MVSKCENVNSVNRLLNWHEKTFMGLVRCLTDKRHKPYQINTLVYIFLFFKSTREFSRYSLAKKSDICRWCVFTHSLCNPIFFFVLRKKIAPLVFYLVPPISLFLSNACLFLPRESHSLSHNNLGTEFWKCFFFHSLILTLFKSYT